MPRLPEGADPRRPGGVLRSVSGSAEPAPSAGSPAGARPGDPSPPGGHPMLTRARAVMLAASTAALLLPRIATAGPFCSDPKPVTDPEIRAEIADLRKA